MIVGLGTDIVDLKRIEAVLKRFGERFLQRICAPCELAAAVAPGAAFTGGRFAAKEAAVKALGTGFAHGILPAQISILNAESGQPRLVFSDAALAAATALGARRWHVSISHERRFALATVILED
ncbi:MAG: holo-ACP synthase [Desulfovibrio sp.]|nr:holo-ACP synthase [Desulfovibrio sp.]